MTTARTRHSTIREALGQTLKKKKLFAGKLRGKYLFRAAARLVVEYMDWISDSIMQDEIGENVHLNVKMAQRKKLAEDELSAEDRGMLFIPPSKRSKTDVAYIENLLRNLRVFKRYPEDVRDLLAEDILLQYVTPGRTVIRQDHEAKLMYYVAKGNLQIIKDTVDEITGESSRDEIGELQQGDIFGEIALMHNVPRTATVVSKTACDLLIVTKRSFETHLKKVLLEEWDILHDALINFNYFKGWSESTMRECCILSKIVNYKANEILLGDGKGMIHYVYFIISGECRLIEHMLVEKKKYGKKVKHRLYDSKQNEKNPRQRLSRSKKVKLFEDDDPSVILGTRGSSMASIPEKDQTTAKDYIKMLAGKKAGAKVALDRLSVITVTLQDVINQWHEIGDAVEMLMKQPSVSSLVTLPNNVETVFMQICMYYRGACFGLGENMRNRRVVSICPTTCLLIPRFWLKLHNRANIWERVKFFLDSKFPTQSQVLETCVEHRKWAMYKKDYADYILKNGRDIPNDTKDYDVPYSIRINDKLEEA